MGVEEAALLRAAVAHLERYRSAIEDEVNRRLARAEPAPEVRAEVIRRFRTFVRLASLSPEAAHFFRCHDTVHVVFGCGTTLDDEAVVKIASLLGTTAGLVRFRLAEVRP